MTIYATAQVCDASLPDLIIRAHPDPTVGVTISSKDGLGQSVTLGWAVLGAMLATKPAETAPVVAGVHRPEAAPAIGNGEVAAGGKA